MSDILKSSKIAVVGAGAMGSGIAQVAAAAGHSVLLFDTRLEALQKAINGIHASVDKLVDKQKITSETASAIKLNLIAANTLTDLTGSSMVIEAIVEQVNVKQELFSSLEKIVDATCILASNTSSLSVTAIAAACQFPERVIGLHFFNPAAIMPLVEVIPAVQTKSSLPQECMQLMEHWGKVPVLAKDTPGFIVNRVARPFYGESLRICEEGIADQSTIDWALKTIGSFRMGPFELMDLIGNDINYTVTETVWTQCYFDQRYKPSLIQKKMVESGRLGRKTAHGYYDYRDGAVQLSPVQNEALGKTIVERVVAMLFIENAESLYYGIATASDLDLAVTKGVNYPKGLLAWADEWGAQKVLNILDDLYNTYREDRYRASVLLRKHAINNTKFFA